MTPIYQTIFDQTSGNCMQACAASILDLTLEDVPNFITFPDWRQSMTDFFAQHGYALDKERCLQSNAYTHFLETGSFPECTGYLLLPIEYSINGLFMAGVFSPRFFNIEEPDRNMHQVLCDQNCNIIHDPCPVYKGIKKYPLADQLGSNGVLNVDIIQKI